MFKASKIYILFMLSCLVLGSFACSSRALEATQTPTGTNTVVTLTKIPTKTLSPTNTPSPTLVPTSTLAPPPIPTVQTGQYAYSDSYFDIFLVKADDLGEEQFNIQTKGLISPELTWSPDGSKLFYFSTVNNEDPECYSCIWELFVLDVEADETFQISHGMTGSALWSPDGQKILYTQPRFFGEFAPADYFVYLSNSDGTEQQLIFERAYSFPIWSPDGERMAILHSREQRCSGGFEWGVGCETTDLFVVNLDGTGTIRLTDDVEFQDTPKWSPDSSYIAFLSEPDENSMFVYELWVVDRDGKNLRALSPNLTPEENFEWSPDSSKIAFSDGNSKGLWVVNVDGSELLSVVPNTHHIEYFRWAPLGSQILYSVTESEENDGVYVIKLDSLETIKLACGGEWSQDGNWIICSDGFMRSDGSEFVPAIIPTPVNINGMWRPMPELQTEELTYLVTPFIPTPTFSCPNAPRSRLKVGDTARIAFVDGSTTRVRSTPEILPSNVAANLAEGTELEIVGGPVCVPASNQTDTFIFWEVFVSSGNLTGWVAEGDFNDYYIEPWP